MELFNTHINIFIQNLGPWADPLMQFISALGTEYFLLLLITIIYWGINPGLGIRMGIALMTTSCLNSYLKIIFHLPRPYWVDSKVIPYSSESSFGFPSGHSQKAAATWGVLAYFLKRPVAIAFAILLIFLIGISRLYLGVHFSTDVLAGWFLGFFLLIIIITLEKPFTSWLASKNNIQTFLILASFGLVLIILGIIAQNNLLNFSIPASWYQLAERGGNSINPNSLKDLFSGIGIWIGLSAGYCWLRSLEKTYGKYHVAGPTSQKIWRVLVGLAGTLFLWAGLSLFSSIEDSSIELIFRLFRYGIIGFWVSGLAPFVFYKTGLNDPKISTIVDASVITQ
jgi:membrane-associated phospholipid phosphatase